MNDTFLFECRFEMQVSNPEDRLGKEERPSKTAQLESSQHSQDSEDIIVSSQPLFTRRAKSQTALSNDRIPIVQKPSVIGSEHSESRDVQNKLGDDCPVETATCLPNEDDSQELLPDSQEELFDTEPEPELDKCDNDNVEQEIPPESSRSNRGHMTRLNSEKGSRDFGGVVDEITALKEPKLQDNPIEVHLESSASSLRSGEIRNSGRTSHDIDSAGNKLTLNEKDRTEVDHIPQKYIDDDLAIKSEQSTEVNLLVQAPVDGPINSKNSEADSQCSSGSAEQEEFFRVMLSTPPSRSRLNGKPPKRAKLSSETKDNSLDFIPSELSRTLDKNVLSKEEQESSQCESKVEIPSANLSPDTEVTFKTPKVRYVEALPTTISDRSPHELSFTQISPGALSAACQAVEKAEISGIPSDRNSTLNQNDSNNDSATNNTFKSSGGFQTAESTNSFQVEGKSQNDGNFSQISPMVLNAMANAADSTRLSTSTPIACHSSLPRTEMDITPVLKQDTHTPVRWKNDQSPLLTPESGLSNVDCKSALPAPVKQQPLQQTTSPKSGFSLRRKAKRFSYPTSSQIADSCPKRIFNFKPTEELTVKNNIGQQEDTVEKVPEVHQDVRDPSGVPPTKKETPKPYWKRSSTGFSIDLYTTEEITGYTHPVPDYFKKIYIFTIKL